ncbi:endonuclease [Candidatus Woesearchaeota archaeon]|nr:endonuclease [Candidatus Woesearchaeota archaeon]
MNKIKQIYAVLYKTYGPQRWWPTTLEGELHPSYHGGKINEKQRFEIIVGAILTQNTSWKNVEKAIIELNKAKVLSIDGIKKINVRRLAKLIKSAGYYNQKAGRLKIVAKFFDGKKDVNRDELLEVKGIGPETADSILLYVFEKPYFVVDAYTKRIMSRIGFRFKDYDELQKIFMSLGKNVKLFNEYHALLVELAKRHCKVKPECKGCPIFKMCKRKI